MLDKKSCLTLFQLMFSINNKSFKMFFIIFGIKHNQDLISRRGSSLDGFKMKYYDVHINLEKYMEIVCNWYILQIIFLPF